jgi:MoxR-like ATPase
MVLATQNPIEYEGTFPLPEAQLDRFLLKLSLGYLDNVEEKDLLLHLRRQHPIDSLQAVSSGDQILPLAEQIWDVHVDDTLRDYIVRLVQATRQHPDLMLGASPRGSLALYKTGQALAALRGRAYVLPDDIKLLAPLALAHRCIVRPESALRGRTADLIVQEILAGTPLDIGQLA